MTTIIFPSSDLRDGAFYTGRRRQEVLFTSTYTRMLSGGAVHEDVPQNPRNDANATCKWQGI